MNFVVKPNKEKEMIGTTSKENCIRYTIVPEEKLRYWKPEPVMDEINILNAGKIEIDRLNRYNMEYKAATRIRIDCNFHIQMRMMDLLESSKILSVEYMKDIDDTFGYIIIIPQLHFDYEKLNDILFDMVQKFDL